jgi:hypothetical protein
MATDVESQFPCAVPEHEKSNTNDSDFTFLIMSATTTTEHRVYRLPFGMVIDNWTARPQDALDPIKNTPCDGAGCWGFELPELAGAGDGRIGGTGWSGTTGALTCVVIMAAGG